MHKEKYNFFHKFVNILFLFMKNHRERMQLKEIREEEKRKGHNDEKKAKKIRAERKKES